VDPQYEYGIAATIEDWQNEGNHVFSFFVRENCDEVKQSVLGTEMVDTTVTQEGRKGTEPVRASLLGISRLGDGCRVARCGVITRHFQRAKNS
jgi:hypothetical protein